MTGDDRPKALPVPSAFDHVSGGRGGPEERVAGSVVRAIDAARARVTPSAPDDTADAVERRRLIGEIRTMRRYRVNVVFEGIITGVVYTGGVFALLHLGRWFIGALRAPPMALPAPEPPPTQQPTAQQTTPRPP
jgi:hypothetical protein